MKWTPQRGPQTQALTVSSYETLYGGARGGGKTDAGLVWLVKPYLINNPKYRALVIRRNSDDLVDWIDRARVMYHDLGAEFAGKPTEIRFPSGAKIRTGHLKDDNAYTKYQGHEYQRILIEELTQIPQERYYITLIGSCRSTVPEIDPRIFATTNPGNAGHVWVKERFIDPAPWGKEFIGKDSQRSRIFIPAKLEDNPILMRNDPGYLLYLEGIKLTDEELYKAWRKGDWNVFAGRFFREFDRAKHVIPSFTPNYANKEIVFVGGLDWGRSKPFAFEGSLVIKVRLPDIQPFYRVITFSETYGVEKNPKQWSDEITQKINLNRFEWVQADNQIFAPGNDGGVDIATQFANADERWKEKLKPSIKDRIGGWQNIHNWLSLAPDGLPYWLITDNCINLIKTLPELIHDELNVEDIDEEGEDHAADAIRYMFMKIEWIDARIGGLQHRRPVQAVKARLSAAPMRIDLSKFEKTPLDKASWQEV